MVIWNRILTKLYLEEKSVSMETETILSEYRSIYSKTEDYETENKTDADNEDEWEKLAATYIFNRLNSSRMQVPR